MREPQAASSGAPIATIRLEPGCRLGREVERRCDEIHTGDPPRQCQVSQGCAPGASSTAWLRAVPRTVPVLASAARRRQSTGEPRGRPRGHRQVGESAQTVAYDRSGNDAANSYDSPPQPR